MASNETDARDDRKNTDARMKKAIDQKLVESGEKERWKHLQLLVETPQDKLRHEARMAENMSCVDHGVPIMTTKNGKQKQRGGKRRSLTVQEKVRIVREIESGRTQSDVCRDRDLVHSTVSKIWKQRERIVAAFEMDVTKSRRLRGAARKDLDASLLLWFNFQRSQNVPVNGPALQAKAEELARGGGDLDFHCSSGWIDRFKARHNIAFTKGRSASARARATAYNTEWLTNVWPELRRDYDDEDVFGADEMGLYYRLPPNKSSCEMTADDLISVLVCVNVTGTEKRRLVVIGKPANDGGLRCFDGVRSLPVRFEPDPRSWMTQEIFGSVLRDWDDELRRTSGGQRKILLLVDSCPAHPRTSADLECIKLIHMPATVAHPVSEGVARVLKNHYRRLLLLHFVECRSGSNPPVITVMDAIRMLHRSWLRVCDRSIRNSFVCSGLTTESQPVETDGTADDVLPLSEWLSRRHGGRTAFEQLWGVDCSADTLDEYARIDDMAITTSPPLDVVATPQPPLLSMMEPMQSMPHVPSSRDGCSSLPTAKDALHAVRLVSHFLERHDVAPSLLDDSARVENEIETIVWSTDVVGGRGQWELLRTRLIECGWQDQLKFHCKDIIKKKGLENVTVDDLVQEVTPIGRSSVPDSVKRELLTRIRTYIAQENSTSNPA